MPTPTEVENFIKETAKRFGIPEWIAAGVARAESGFNADNPGDYYVDWLHYPAGTTVIARRPNGAIVPKGTPGAVPTSFGPFQLRAGQHVTGDPAEAGLGDQAINAGIDVRNPSTWQQQIVFALQYAKSRGTFAGTWSTAVGELAQSFTAGAVDPSERIIPTIPPGGATVVVPGQVITPTTKPGSSSFPITPQSVAASGVSWVSGLELPQGFTVLAQTIADATNATLKAITAPVNQAAATMAYLGQVNIYKRLGFVLLGMVLVVLGIVLFGVSLVPKEVVSAVAKVA